MTISELLSTVDEIRPNQISKETKVLWLNEIEHRVFEEIICRAADTCPFFVYRPYNYEADAEAILIVPDTYGDVYRTYLYAKLDETLGEIDRYNNDAALFSSAFHDFAAFYRRHHYPKERRHRYGKAPLPFLYGPEPSDCGGIQRPEPDPRCERWGICGPEKCLFPVLPCYQCEEAEESDSGDADET